jgi:hypothetical protein
LQRRGQATINHKAAEIVVKISVKAVEGKKMVPTALEREEAATTESKALVALTEMLAVMSMETERQQVVAEKEVAILTRENDAVVVVVAVVGCILILSPLVPLSPPNVPPFL